jgi:hypothetical protein
MFRTLGLQCIANVQIVGRERGKKVPSACREGHNRWVNFGREYLAHVITPNASWEHLNNAVVKYMGFGVGGADQTASVTGDLAAHYPGQATFVDNDLTVAYLERPIKVTGTPGVGTSAGVWLKEITVDGSTTPSFIGNPATTVEFVTTFGATDLHLGGAYTNIPLSEIGLYLSSSAASLVSNQVYDYGSSPAYINITTRQRLLAYFPFAPITKTPAIALEARWQLQF